MKIVKTRVHTFILDSFCECGGRMIRTGITLPSYPAQFPHECDSCKKVENLKSIFPEIIYEHEMEKECGN